MSDDLDPPSQTQNRIAAVIWIKYICNCDLATKMPVTGLPNILEITLNNIIHDMDITSWNIKGEEECMQVIIRFKMAANTTCAPDMQINNATYRKVPQSQIIRNRERTKAWKVQKHDIPHENGYGCNNDILDVSNSTVCNTAEECQQQTPVLVQETDTYYNTIVSPAHDHKSIAYDQNNIESLTQGKDLLKVEDMHDIANDKVSSAVHLDKSNQREAIGSSVADNECKQVIKCVSEIDLPVELKMIKALNKELPAKCVECQKVFKSMDKVVHRCKACVGFICKGECYKNHAEHDMDMTGSTNLFQHQKHLRTVIV